MQISATSAVLLMELAFLLGGLLLLWRLGLSLPARQRPPLLTEWQVTLSDFFLFIWLVIIGGLAAEYAVALYLKFHPLDEAHQLIYGTAVLHAGMLLGIAGYGLIFARGRPRVSFAIGDALRSGPTTFLISLPVLTAVTVLWQGALKLCHITPKAQASIELLQHTTSTPLRAVLLVTAILVAPVSEELIFRAGIFRYVRTRLPRWAALLVPAVLFALLHADLGSFLPLMALAVIFSLAYERTGNIGTTMIAHALFNLNSTLLVLVGFDNTP